jgi:hypothetical protein
MSSFETAIVGGKHFRAGLVTINAAGFSYFSNSCEVGKPETEYA